MYAVAEALWYLSREGDAAALLPYAPKYANYIEEDGKAHGAYGERIATNCQVWHHDGPVPVDQLMLVQTMLEKQDFSRQAVITLWDASKDLPHAAAGDRKDIPCTLTFQFIVRDGELHVVVNMRSQDVWLGMPYDVFTFTTIQYVLAGMLRLEVGTYTHNVGSLHLYEPNFEAASEARKVHMPEPGPSLEWKTGAMFGGQDRCCVDLEQKMRIGQITSSSELVKTNEWGIMTSPFRDMVAVLAQYWLTDTFPLSPLFEEVLQTHADHRRRRLSRQDDIVQDIA